MKNLKEIRLILMMTLVLSVLVISCGREGPDAPPDLIPPEVSSTSPYYQEQDVAINTSITVKFSELMNTTSLNNKSLILQFAGAGVSGSVTCSGSTAVFRPDQNLNPNSTYNVIVETEVKDIAGNAMAAPYIYSFTTGTRTTTDTHTITVAPAENGNITPDGTVSVNDGESRTFTVTPDAGYHISSVSGCGGTLSGTTYSTGPITADCTVTASFSADGQETHTVTARVSSGSGSITPGSATVSDGGTASFTVKPDTGWQISSVSGCGGSLIGSSTYRTGAITGPCEVVASFKTESPPPPPPPPVTYTISADADANGTIIPQGAVEVAAGANQSFTIQTDGVFIISSVEVDGRGIDIPLFEQTFTYTFINVDRDHTIKAKFKRFWKIEASVYEGSGSIIPSGSVYVEDGAAQSFDLVPGPDYVVSDVSVDEISVGPVPRYVFPAVNSDHTIRAVFSESTPTDGGYVFGEKTAVTSAREPNPFFAIVSGTVCSGSPRDVFTPVPAVGRAVAAGFGGNNVPVVTPSPGGNGEIISTAPRGVPYRGTRTFEIAPA